MASSDADETIPAETGSEAGPADLADQGADVARDPDVIQREIEQTRAELADTIDAIADRVSPKRAASRGVSAVKAQVSSVIDRASGSSDDGPPSQPASVLDAGSAEAGDRQLAPAGVSQFTGTTEYAVSRTLRTDRVLMVVGVGAAVAALVIIRRSRS